MDKWLGKISSVKFGYGGYQDAMFGLSVTLSSDNSGVSDFKGAWSSDITVGEYTKWTEADRSKQNDETVRFINQIMKDAKVRSLDELQGIPVEVTVNGNTLDSWRILTEVL